MGDKIYKITAPLYYDPKIGVRHESFFVSGHLCTYYSLGKFSEAKSELIELGYGLTAFGTLEDAQYFAKKFEVIAIFEATGEGKIKTIGPRRACLFTKDLHDFINIELMNEPWPRGTVMYQRIRLDKRIS